MTLLGARRLHSPGGEATAQWRQPVRFRSFSRTELNMEAPSVPPSSHVQNGTFHTHWMMDLPPLGFLEKSLNRQCKVQVPSTVHRFAKSRWIACSGLFYTRERCARAPGTAVDLSQRALCSRRLCLLLLPLRVTRKNPI